MKDFKLDTLLLFTPGNLKTDVEKNFKNGKVIRNDDDILLVRYEVSHTHYKFPVFVQYKNDIIHDMSASLPQYFLHDVFHQSLINRFKKQDKYKRVDEEAVYEWSDVKGVKMTYGASCTITCFPVFLNMEIKDLKIETIQEKLVKGRIKF